MHEASVPRSTGGANVVSSIGVAAGRAVAAHAATDTDFSPVDVIFSSARIVPDPEPVKAKGVVGADAAAT